MVYTKDANNEHSGLSFWAIVHIYINLEYVIFPLI